MSKNTRLRIFMKDKNVNRFTSDIWQSLLGDFAKEIVDQAHRDIESAKKRGTNWWEDDMHKEDTMTA